jgi:hypothetical protein
MAKTYEPIATTTLASAAASYTFSSISQSYTDLILISTTTNDSVDYSLAIKLNGDTTGTLYSRTILSGNGTAAASSRGTSEVAYYPLYSANLAYPAFALVNFLNYSNTTTYKTFLSRGNVTQANVYATVGLRRSTEAISTIAISPTAGNFAIGSTFTLYGIKAA